MEWEETLCVWMRLEGRWLEIEDGPFSRQCVWSVETSSVVCKSRVSIVVGALFLESEIREDVKVKDVYVT